MVSVFDGWWTPRLSLAVGSSLSNEMRCKTSVPNRRKHPSCYSVIVLSILQVFKFIVMYYLNPEIMCLNSYGISVLNVAF